MNIKIASKEVEIHVTPLEEITIGTTEVCIDFDDINEKRWRVKFSPYQAFRTTTIDCIDTKSFLINGKRPFHILEVTDSMWIEKIDNVLKTKDTSAVFLEKAHHYVLPFQDIIVEVVAGDNFRLEKK